MKGRRLQGAQTLNGYYHDEILTPEALDTELKRLSLERDRIAVEFAVARDKYGEASRAYKKRLLIVRGTLRAVENIKSATELQQRAEENAVEEFGYFLDAETELDIAKATVASLAELISIAQSRGALLRAALRLE